MCIPTLRSVAAATSTAGVLLSATAGDGSAGLCQLLVRRPAGSLRNVGVRPERFYPDRIVSTTLGMAIAGNVAFDPAAAACLSEGESRPKKWQAGQYARGLQHLAGDLAQTTTRRESLHA